MARRLGVTRRKRLFAHHLREDATHAEAIVWELLRGRKFGGLKFRRQHVIRGFIVDFYCPELRLAVEIDGEVHMLQRAADVRRDEILGTLGIRTIRIPNNEVLKDPARAPERIRELGDGGDSK